MHTDMFLHGVCFSISVATGGLGGPTAPPSVPRMGREIRANPMSFFLGGYPLCGGLALVIEGPFFLLQCLLSFQGCKLYFTQRFQKQRESTCSLLLLFA